VSKSVHLASRSLWNLHTRTVEHNEHYVYDHVYGEKSTQGEIFQDIAASMLQVWVNRVNDE
jgi:hypothetical protein